MNSDDYYIDPDATNLVLNSLSQMADEKMLLHEVELVSRQLIQLEQAGAPPHQLKKLNQYITVLEVQVNYLKDRSDKLLLRSNN